VLGIGEPARVGMQVQHGMPELRVVPVHLLDDLLRAADERRTAGDEVLKVGEPRTVVPDQLGIRLDRVGDVRGEQRFAVAGGQVDRFLAGRAAVPDPDRLLERSGPHFGFVQRRRNLGVAVTAGFRQIWRKSS
jgi:hypothetical protein